MMTSMHHLETTVTSSTTCLCKVRMATEGFPEQEDTCIFDQNDSDLFPNCLDADSSLAYNQKIKSSTSWRTLVGDMHLSWPEG